LKYNLLIIKLQLRQTTLKRRLAISQEFHLLQMFTEMCIMTLDNVPQLAQNQTLWGRLAHSTGVCSWRTKLHMSIWKQ